MRRLAGFVVLTVFVTAGTALAAMGGMKPLSSIHFEADADVKCLSSALETGDPLAGPSTFVLKAPPGCVVPWHFHTAEEQAVVIRGDMKMEMTGESPAHLGPGGFAVMAGKVAHKFTCTGKSDCIVTVFFNGKYDIFWGKEKN